MGVLYANKKFVVEVREAQEDGTLITQHGEIPYSKGEKIGRNLKGEKMVLPDDYFNENYVEIKVNEPKKQSILSLARGYIEMGKLIKEENESGNNTY